MTLYCRELTIASKVRECCWREFAVKLGEFDYSRVDCLTLVDLVILEGIRVENLNQVQAKS